jgi:DNA-binding beta-propeller fold protein YncE
MKAKFLFVILITVFSYRGIAQKLSPAIQFNEDPRTHNVHICSDGKYYYTINGGISSKGMINKYDLKFKLLSTYDIELDMRSIMYEPKEGRFYVCTYEKNIYKITDITTGKFELLKESLYDDPQSSLALSPDGKLLYAFDKGEIKIYKFPSCTLVNTIKGFDSGKTPTTGSCVVAVGSKYIYTWNTEYKLIFIYNLKGKKIKSVEIEDGDYGFSLSAANGKIFVSKDGNYDVGNWYGYEF